MSHLRFPRSIDSAKELGRLLSKYKDTHYFTVLGSVITTYVLYPTVLTVLRSVYGCMVWVWVCVRCKVCGVVCVCGGGCVQVTSNIPICVDELLGQKYFLIKFD